MRVSMPKLAKWNVGGLAAETDVHGFNILWVQRPIISKSKRPFLHRLHEWTPNAKLVKNQSVFNCLDRAHK